MLDQQLVRLVQTIVKAEIAKVQRMVLDGVVDAVDGDRASVRIGGLDSEPLPGFHVSPSLSLESGDHVLAYRLGGYQTILDVLDRNALDTTDQLAGALSIFDVREFGARAGGSLDCTTAFNLAIIACQEAGGGCVVIPRGLWKVTAELVVSRDNVTIVGAGPEATTIYNTGTGRLLHVYDPGNAASVQRFSLRDLTLLGNSASTVGLDIRAGIRMVTIDRVAFRGHGTWGMFIDRDTSARPSNRIAITNCEFRENYPTDTTLGNGGGIRIEPSSAQIWLYGNSIRAVSGSYATASVGLYISQSNQNVTIYGGDITSHARGVHIQGDAATNPALGLVFRGVYFEKNRYHVYGDAATTQAKAVASVIIADNYLKGADTAAVRVEKGSRWSIKDNYVQKGDAGGASDFVHLGPQASQVMIGTNAFDNDFTGAVVSIISGTPTYSYYQPYVQHKRSTGNVVPLNGNLTVTLTWDAAFPDTSYDVAVSVHITSGGGGLMRHVITAKAAGSVDVLIHNENAANRTVTVYGIAMKDGI